MDEVREFFDTLHGEGAYRYFWTFPRKKSYWFKVEDAYKIPNGDAQNIYFGVHPCREIPKDKAPELVRGRNEAVERVYCLYAEFDNQNKDEIYEHLKELPEPTYIIDSGGGLHCYWVLTEPYIIENNEDLITIDGVQKAWVDFCGGDPGAKDLARVLRVPGTLNHKYDPPREVYFVDTSLKTYDLDYLRSLIPSLQVDGGLIIPWVDNTIPEVISPGGRNTTLTSLAGSMRRRGMSGDGILAALLVENQNKCKPPLPDKEVQTIAKSVSRYEPDETIPELESFCVVSWATKFDELPKIEWVWEKWLPKGFITIIVGSSEIGKSTIALKIADCILNGSVFPDGSWPEHTTGDVVWLDTESSEVLNLDRAHKMGIPLERVIVPAVDGITDIELWDPEGWAAFEACCRRPGIELIVIDSLGGAHVRESDETIKILVKRLGRLARDLQVPVVVHHPRKLQLGEAKELTMDRVRGSSAIVQFARMIWAIEKPNPFEDTRRIKVLKSNLAKKPNSVGFDIEDVSGTMVVVWNEAPETPEIESQSDKAAKMIRECIKPGEKVPATTIYKRAEEAGISEIALKRAKKELSISSIREGKKWYWLIT